MQKFGKLLQFALIVLVLALVGPGPSARELDVPGTPQAYRMYGDSRALLVAVTDYQDPEWDTLHPINGAVERLRVFLEAQGFETRVLHNPTSEELLRELRIFLRNAPRDGRSIVYLGGHGWTDPENYNRGYFVPADAPSPTTDMAAFRALAISSSDIRNLAFDSQARHTLFLVDSCMSAALFAMRSPPMMRQTPEPAPEITYWEELSRGAAQYFTAGSDDQRVPAVSPFVDMFIEGIRVGAGHSDQPFVTARELGSWLRRRMRADNCYRDRLSPQTGAIPVGRTGPLGLGGYDTTQNQGDMVFLVPADDGTPIRTTCDAADQAAAPAQQPSSYARIAPRSLFVPIRMQTETPAQVAAAAPEPAAHPTVAEVAATSAPYAPEAALFADLQIFYFRKSGDRRRVIDVLNNLDAPYFARPAQLSVDTTNMIACGPDLDPRALRTLALSLMDAGVEIRRIDTFRFPQRKPNRIEILSAANAVNWAPLTREQILGLQACPDNLHN